MRTLERVVGILEVVAENPAPMTASAVAGAVGLSLSTTSRLMRELSEEGLLERGYEGGAYSLGARVLSLARAALQPSDLLEAAIPEMQALRDLTGETVSLHVRRGGSRVCMAQVQSPHPVRRVVPVGFMAPLHIGATGEMLLAQASTHEVDAYLEEVGLSRAKRSEVKRRVKAARDQGWAAAVDALAEGLSGVSVAIGNGEEILAALTVSGPANRWTMEVMENVVPDVHASAARISRALRPGVPA